MRDNKKRELIVVVIVGNGSYYFSQLTLTFLSEQGMTSYSDPTCLLRKARNRKIGKHGWKTMTELIVYFTVKNPDKIPTGKSH